MTRRGFAALAVPALTLLLLAPLDAQTPGIAAQSVPAGATVRAARAGIRVTGRLQNASRDTLVIISREGHHLRLPLADVDTLWRADRATGRGAAIGAVAGGIVLAGLGVLAARGLCESGNGCADGTRTYALRGAVIGAAGGAILGAGLGSRASVWRRVHP